MRIYVIAKSTLKGVEEGRTQWHTLFLLNSPEMAWGTLGHDTKAFESRTEAEAFANVRGLHLGRGKAVRVVAKFMDDERGA